MLPPFVSAAWLADHRDDVVLADVRFYLDGRSARAGYDAGHLPGAVYVDLEQWLSGPGSAEAGRHPLPDPDVFARGMASCGIGDDTTAVAYDDAGGVIAARLVWMLRALGVDAALLDGGTSTGDLTTTPPPSPPPATFTPRSWPAELLVDTDHVLDGSILIDARPRERYDGAPDGVDPRSGHIPGAASVPCREHLDATGDLLPDAELRTHFASAGITSEDDDVISYCGSGVTACHNLLVLEHLNLGHHRLFPGSWSQWSSNPSLPITNRST